MNKADWFKGLDAEVVDQIAQRAQEKKYKNREFLYMPGDVQDNLYYVISGTVQVSIVGYAGSQFILASMKSGQWFGEGAIIGMTKVIEVQTVTPATLLVVPLNAVKQVVGTEASFYKNILEDHMGRVQLLYELIAGMLFLPLRARLAGRLLYLLEMFGKPSDEGLVLDMKFSQQDFARMSMGSRQRINKIFREWQARDIYYKRSGKYIVKDIAALTEELEADDDA
ncbi:Crp/Fnr family transcriptional regulator [Arenicella sp. 4NH20-0111]|uniref:Crp/Fnr family transcriptional regulator n=1 Tax=Arenicella sp. 4NH20-0111 TaxID=3127648 RepID=UPI003341F641